ncbi:MAG: lactate utilization protein [Verrucomicrobiaceae bacterium]|nr:lactate utilization protein [Verrucomicrobiaceae bacterium]
METLLENLRKRGFVPHFFNTANEAKEFFKAELKNNTIGIGGSVTISQLGLYDMLSEGNTVYSHSVDKSPNVLENASLAEVYISGANAIAETGEIVNIDGRGNRVSSVIWGANRKKVYIVSSTNKVVATLEDAIFRAKNVAAPQNAKRLNLKTPCAIKADKCYKCNSPDKICRVLTVLGYPTSAETHIVLIAENLGY